MFRLKRCFLCLFCASCATLFTSCRESDEEEKLRRARFTTETKPPPNPDQIDLESLIKEDYVAPSLPQEEYAFSPYSHYEGGDIKQLTGVSGRSLLLCFATEWCPYSKSMKAALKELSEKAQGEMQVVIIDPDQYKELAEEFGIKQIPMTFLYTEGVRLRSIEGNYSATSLEQYLKRVLTDR